MKIARMLTVVLLFAAAAGLAAAQEALKPQIAQIDDNERVVHIVGTPFNHGYYEPRLETLLLQRYAGRGLVFRVVNMENFSMDELLKDLDSRVMIHKPTLVIVQAGNDDLRKQYRRVTFDFTVYPKPVEAIVKKLRAANVKVILCSVIPQGNGSTKDKLLPPNDGLKTWVDAAREIAARNNTPFVDLFTEALEWPMIDNSKTYYDTAGHHKSWELFTKQICFEPAGASVAIDAKGKPPQCQGATVTDLKTDGGLSFLLQNAAGAGPLILKISGLPTGNHAVTVNEKPLAAKSAEELAAGIDLDSCLQTQSGSKEFKEEIARGHKAVADLAGIQNYSLPVWVKQADFEQQKPAAVQAALEAVKAHDAAMLRMVTPNPLAVRITPAK